jgi:hypothetical protein
VLDYILDILYLYIVRLSDTPHWHTHTHTHKIKPQSCSVPDFAVRFDRVCTLRETCYNKTSTGHNIRPKYSKTAIKYVAVCYGFCTCQYVHTVLVKGKKTG